MIRINENFTKLKASYLFSDIAKRVAAFQRPTHRNRSSGSALATSRAAAARLCGGIARRRRRAQPARDVQGLWPRAGLRLPARGHRATRFPGARLPDRARRNLRLRRLEMRLRQHPGNLRPDIRLAIPIQFIPCMSTPTSWRGAPAPTSTAVTRASPISSPRPPTAMCPPCRTRRPT